MSENHPTKAPKQDRDLHLPVTTRGGRSFVTWAPELGVKILEMVAEGGLLSKICKQPGIPSHETVRKWLMRYPAFAQAMTEARKFSAMAFEEKALDLGDAVVQNPDTSVKVRAHEVAMNQLRWSASRRNPAEYGDKSSLNIAIPVQINTGLDLGGGAPAAQTDDGNIYSLSTAPPEEIVVPEEEVAVLAKPDFSDMLEGLLPAYDATAPRKRKLIPPDPSTFRTRKEKPPDKRLSVNK